MATYWINPTCGHEAMRYHMLKLAKAHAQAHADRSGYPVHITREDASGIRHIATMSATTDGPYTPCDLPQHEQEMRRHDD